MMLKPEWASEIISTTARYLATRDAVGAYRVASMYRPKEDCDSEQLFDAIRAAVHDG